MKAVNESPNLSVERIESLKAGILAGLALALAESLIIVGNHWGLAQWFEVLASLPSPNFVDVMIKIAIAFLSGFLFGVTYRYAIREDENPQLKAGVVLAFGLVRGLAPVEVEQNVTDAFGLLAVLSLESIVSFAIARFTLDWAIHHHWVKLFN